MPENLGLRVSLGTAYVLGESKEGFLGGGRDGRKEGVIE
jgi:hypothetical protein